MPILYIITGSNGAGKSSVGPDFMKYNTMLTMEKLNMTMNNLPDSFTIGELIDQLIFIEKVDEGFQQSEKGNIISNEDVKLIIDRWSQ